MPSLSNHAARPLALIAAFLVSISLIGTVSGQSERTIYTWTDGEGVRHYSAYPPQDQPYEQVETIIGTGTRTRAQRPEASPSEPPALPEMGESEPDAALVAERCEQARTNLDLLRQDRPALLRREDGEPTPLDDEQRQQMIEEAEAFIEEWC